MYDKSAEKFCVEACKGCDSASRVEHSKTCRILAYRAKELEKEKLKGEWLAVDFLNSCADSFSTCSMKYDAELFRKAAKSVEETLFKRGPRPDVS